MNPSTRLHQVACIAFACFVTVGCALGAAVQGNADIHDLVETPNKSEHERFSQDDLEILRESLPSLHSQLTSPEWEGLNGSENQRIAAKAVLQAWGSRAEDIGDLLERIAKFELAAPPESRDTVDMAWGHAGHFLVQAFVILEREKRSLANTKDAFSVVKADYPDQIAELGECLDYAIEQLEDHAPNHFDLWVLLLEDLASNQLADPAPMTADAEIDFEAKVLGLSSDWFVDLGKHLTRNSGILARLCIGDMDFSTEEG